MGRCQFTTHRIVGKAKDPTDWWEVCDPCFDALVRLGEATGQPPNVPWTGNNYPHFCECPLGSCGHERTDRPYRDEGR